MCACFVVEFGKKIPEKIQHSSQMGLATTPHWWTFQISNFFLLGGGEGGVRGARRRGVGLVLTIPGGRGALAGLVWSMPFSKDSGKGVT